LFITVFLTLYGLLHLYAFLKVQRAFVLSRGSCLAMACFMLLMLLCPVFLRGIERYGMNTLSKTLAMAGFVWMGFLFLFVFGAVVMDLYRWILTLITHVLQGKFNPWVPSPRMVFFTALTLSILLTVYGYLEAMTIRPEQITIQTPKIPKALGRLRIVQVSDIHLGWLVGEKRLEKILSKVREAKPDILVSTGDLVDGQMDNCSGLARMFLDIRAPYGKFAIVGNHEFYAGLDRSVRFTQEAGFEILRGTGVDIGGMIYVAGVDDKAGHRYGLVEGDSEEKLLASVPVDRFTLLLKHRPYVNSHRCRGFDLQLSGHTHGGQIFPFSLIIDLIYPVDQGMARLEGGGYLYVSRGSGTWGPPLRVLAPPEITIIDLIHDPGYE